jgi:hypothetical protein
MKLILTEFQVGNTYLNLIMYTVLLKVIGTDIGPIKGNPLVKAGLQPDSQRYFDYHHAANDTFEFVNKRIRTWCSNNGFINLFN